jgi:hypothetical protein
LAALHKRIREQDLINYCEVDKDELEDILKIFVRVNSGGTVLNKTDLLFSTIVATWDDGRDQIENLLTQINERGDGFSFGVEYLMRCCLVLSDGPEAYRVNAFRSENVKKIQAQWPKIAEAVKETVDLLVEFGFSSSVLTSQNATIIVAYYIYKGGGLDGESKKDIRKYLIHALLTGLFGDSQDQLISTLRSAFREEAESETGEMVYRGRYASFSFEEVLKIKLPQHKSLAVTEDDIDGFLQSTKGPSSFFVLSLLYPHLRYGEVVFHQDHIHPESAFTEEKFREMGIPEEQWQAWYDRRDCVPNLQLMEGSQNVSKNATPLIDWVGQMTEFARTVFAKENYFPDGVGLEFKDFDAFFEQRRKVLRRELMRVLALTSSSSPAAPEEWDGYDAEIEGQ